MGDMQIGQVMCSISGAAGIARFSEPGEVASDMSCEEQNAVSALSR